MMSQECFDKVKAYFDNDMHKTWVWFKTPNPGLGSVSPLDMIKSGRIKKLKEFIESRLEGHFI